MIRAVSRACASLIVVAKLFQLFHPIGGVGASKGGLVARARDPVAAGNAVAVPAAADANNSRRFSLIHSSDVMSYKWHGSRSLRAQPSWKFLRDALTFLQQLLCTVAMRTMLEGAILSGAAMSLGQIPQPPPVPRIEVCGRHPGSSGTGPDRSLPHPIR